MKFLKLMLFFCQEKFYETVAKNLSFDHSNLEEDVRELVGRLCEMV